MDPTHEEERRCTVKRLVTTLVCAGLVMTMSPAAAQLPTEWTTVKVFAARWVDANGDPTRVEILKGEAFHDSAIVTDGKQLEWELKCIQFDQDWNVSDCAAELEFAIVDFHFVADLDQIAEQIAPEVSNLDENKPFPEPIKLKRGEKAEKFSAKFKKDFDPAQRGHGQGRATGQTVESGDVDPGFQGKSQLWKYTIVVEDPDAVPPNYKNCLKFPGSPEDPEKAVLAPPDCCDDSALCDIWDPHVYTHGGRDY